MLDIHRDATPDTKIYFTHSVLPSYIDPQNVSAKKQPFATLNKQHFSHTLDLILPDEMYELVRQKLATSRYARVRMKLGDVLEEDFLNAYIKQGNIAMLSEGRPLVDNRFELYEGVLKMELDRPTYGRCGLQGVPIEDGGKKHKKQRWIVTYDLRLPSMKHGKSGFGRLEWAAKNVLNDSLTWLWWNANPTSEEALREGREVLSKHAPWIHEMEPSTTMLEGVLVPKLGESALDKLYEQDESLDMLEYLNLLSLESPRLKAKDSVDPAISRYEVPDFGPGRTTRDMVCVRWRGLLTPAFVRDVFLGTTSTVYKSRGKTNGTSNEDVDGDVDMGTAEAKWFALSAQGFGGHHSWTVMQFENRETLTWEAED
jgi:ribonuclease P/MRP protein subunit RPP40